jgi:hypothetical protein
MKTWVRKTLSVGVLAAGALLFAPGAAHADGHQSNGDNNGILNGTQLVTGVQVPVNVVGNSLGILGEADSFGTGINRVEGTHVGQINGDNDGILNGTQAYLPVSVPLNLAGNAAAIAGEADSAARAGNRVESAHTTEGWWGERDGGQFNGDNSGIGNGTQIYAPVSVPINACGNAIAVLGGAFSQAVCGNEIQESAHVTESGWQSNGDNNGILNGTQLYAPVSLPVNLSGNALGILGSASSHAASGNRIESAQGGWGQLNGDNNGLLNGTQFAAPISLPINVCGNSLGLLGQAGAAAACGNDIFGRDDIWFDSHGRRHHGHHIHRVVLGDHGSRVRGHKPGDPGQYLGDNGNKPATNGYGNGDMPATNGYGSPKGDKPATNGYGSPKGDKPATNGYGSPKGDKPATNGYGSPKGDKPATNGYGSPKGDKPATAGYGGNKDADAPYGKDTRDKNATESLPVGTLTDTVGGAADSSGLGSLGLLNTLR